MKNKIEALWQHPKRPVIIAGPCSAESPDQLRTTAQALVQQGIKVVRAGIWKPRTRPNSFEGIGQVALEWVKDIKQELDVQFAIEVATTQHVELALKAGVDILWLGARTTVNPFTVQELADSLKGVDIPVLVKNPVNPDLALWIGAFERLGNSNIKRIGAVHRGFSLHRKSEYRNEPVWHIPIELKRHFPEMPILCDPSHIGGTKELIESISQKALDLSYNGLMIEVHPNPDQALSDPKQQITPDALTSILNNLIIRNEVCEDAVFVSRLEHLREKIDEIDRELIHTIKSRMAIVDEIGHYKKENNVTIFQLEPWKEIMETRANWAENYNRQIEKYILANRKVHFFTGL